MKLHNYVLCNEERELTVPVEIFMTEATYDRNKLRMIEVLNMRVNTPVRSQIMSLRI